jgi:hypothetical protein
MILGTARNQSMDGGLVRKGSATMGRSLLVKGRELMNRKRPQRAPGDPLYLRAFHSISIYFSNQYSCLVFLRNQGSLPPLLSLKPGCERQVG